MFSLCGEQVKDIMLNSDNAFSIFLFCDYTVVLNKKSFYWKMSFKIPKTLRK